MTGKLMLWRRWVKSGNRQLLTPPMGKAACCSLLVGAHIASQTHTLSLSLSLSPQYPVEISEMEKYL